MNGLELDGLLTLRILDGIALLGLHPSEMMEAIEDRKVRRIDSNCPSNPHGKTGNKRERKRKLDSAVEQLNNFNCK